MQSSLTLHCPACGNRIRARLGCHGEYLVQAVQLQSARCGTELCCHKCRVHHVILRVNVSQDAFAAPDNPPQAPRPDDGGALADDRPDS